MDISEPSPSGTQSPRVCRGRKETPPVVKLQVDENLVAFLSNKTLIRDHVQPLTCDSNIVDKVVLNYIIVKQILSNLDWQNKMICRSVCTTWESAVKSLKKENIAPEDFVMEFSKSKACFRRSGNFATEPMLVVAFGNGFSDSTISGCERIVPKTCEEPCKFTHLFMDIIYKFTSSPRYCMVTIKTDYVTYMALPGSPTFGSTLTSLKVNPFLGGLYIPELPDVNFHKINIACLDNVAVEFMDTVYNIASTRIFKGIICFVTEKYIVQSVGDIVFLNYFKEAQPNIPFALGGCVAEDIFVFESNEMDDVIETVNRNKQYASENLISMGVFTVPKDSPNVDCNFEMFSVILRSSEWSKSDIEQSLAEFSRNVPRFEHSCAFKLSCVGRDQKHAYEQNCFRTHFPNTRIVGCYGNGELGINHPERRPEYSEGGTTSGTKKKRRGISDEFGLMNSYSTVFVYMGWGKITSPVGPIPKS